MTDAPSATGGAGFTSSSHGSRDAATARGNHPPLSVESRT